LHLSEGILGGFLTAFREGVEDSNLLKKELEPEVGAAVEIAGSLLGAETLKALLE
jgi:hypothetical protein